MFEQAAPPVHGPADDLFASWDAGGSSTSFGDLFSSGSPASAGKETIGASNGAASAAQARMGEAVSAEFAGSFWDPGDVSDAGPDPKASESPASEPTSISPERQEAIAQYEEDLCVLQDENSKTQEQYQLWAETAENHRARLGRLKANMARCQRRLVALNNAKDLSSDPQVLEKEAADLQSEIESYEFDCDQEVSLLGDSLRDCEKLKELLRRQEARMSDLQANLQALRSPGPVVLPTPGM
jgi:hypothetical protein